MKIKHRLVERIVGKLLGEFKWTAKELSDPRKCPACKAPKDPKKELCRDCDADTRAL